MAVTEGRILDALADGVARYRVEGERGADWTWVQLTNDERLAFDLFLVRTRDPLAWQAGSPESRFRARVKAMATNTVAQMP